MRLRSTVHAWCGVVVFITAFVASAGCLELLCGGSEYNHARFTSDRLFDRLESRSHPVRYEPARSSRIDEPLTTLESIAGAGNYSISEVRWGWRPDWRVENNDIRLLSSSEVFLGSWNSDLPDEDVRSAFVQFMATVSGASESQMASWADQFVSEDYRIDVEANWTLDAMAASMEAAGGRWSLGEYRAHLAVGDWIIGVHLATKTVRAQEGESFSVTAMERAELVVTDGARERSDMQRRLDAFFAEMELGTAPRDWTPHRSHDAC